MQKQKKRIACAALGDGTRVAHLILIKVSRPPEGEGIVCTWYNSRSRHSRWWPLPLLVSYRSFFHSRNPRTHVLSLLISQVLLFPLQARATAFFQESFLVCFLVFPLETLSEHLFRLVSRSLSGYRPLAHRSRLLRSLADVLRFTC